MTKHIRLYSDHIRYWTGIFAVVVFFGGLLGTAGIARVQNLPSLTLIDSATKTVITTRLDSNTSKIASLETRVTEIEHKIDAPNAK